MTRIRKTAIIPKIENPPTAESLKCTCPLPPSLHPTCRRSRNRRPACSDKEPRQQRCTPAPRSSLPQESEDYPGIQPGSTPLPQVWVLPQLWLFKFSTARHTTRGHSRDMRSEPKFAIFDSPRSSEVRGMKRHPRSARLSVQARRERRGETRAVFPQRRRMRSGPRRLKRRRVWNQTIKKDSEHNWSVIKFFSLFITFFILSFSFQQPPPGGEMAVPPHTSLAMEGLTGKEVKIFLLKMQTARGKKKKKKSKHISGGALAWCEWWATAAPASAELMLALCAYKGESPG